VAGDITRFTPDERGQEGVVGGTRRRCGDRGGAFRRGLSRADELTKVQPNNPDGRPENACFVFLRDGVVALLHRRDGQEEPVPPRLPVGIVDADREIPARHAQSPLDH